jgi:hypothetical protein
MALRPTIRFAVVGLLAACGARAAAAAQSAPADPVAAGYVRIYNGDREGGFKHFEALHAREPESLAFWYGMLFALDRPGGGSLFRDPREGDRLVAGRRAREVSRDARPV